MEILWHIDEVEAEEEAELQEIDEMVDEHRMHKHIFEKDAADNEIMVEVVVTMLEVVDDELDELDEIDALEV